MKIKLCGIRNQEMLEFCAHLPVSYLGLNFVAWSKRKTSLTAPIRKHKIGGIPTVGIFADQDATGIAMTVQKFEISIVQLHGNESAEFIDQLKSFLPDKEIWKAASVDESLSPEKMQEFCKNSDLILLDGKKPGSGERISENQKLSEAIEICEKNNTPYGIAGGINAKNIAEFVRNFPNATVLDTASGLEVDGKFSEIATQDLVTSFYHAQ